MRTICLVRIFNTRMSLGLLAISIVTSLHAQNLQTPFDVNEVIERVSRNQRTVTSTAGEFLIDTNVLYIDAAGEYPSVAFDGSNYFVVWAGGRNGLMYGVYGARVTLSDSILDPAGIMITSANYEQGSPVVVYNGTDYLAVWSDCRNGSDYDIFAARVTTSGILLDSTGFVVSTAADWQVWPSIAFDGVNALVAWQDHRNGTDFDIYGARIAPSGTVLDPSGIAISTITSSWQSHPAVIFGGSNYFVAWESDDDIYGARVSRSGVVLDPSGIAVSTAANRQLAPSVAFDGSNYCIVWDDTRNGSNCDIYGTRVTIGGTVIDPVGIPISTVTNDQSTPSIAFGSGIYLVTWQDSRGSTCDDIYCARVTPSGVVLDPSGIAVSTAGFWQEQPFVAYNGTNFLIVWQDARKLHGSVAYGARVTATGTVLDSSGIVISTCAYDDACATVAFDGSNYLVAWFDRRNGPDYDIYCARVTNTGMVLDPYGIAISTAADDQYSPAVAFDGVNYLVVWDDRRVYPNAIYGARVTRSGIVLDPSGFVVSTAQYWRCSPTVAFDGVNYLVVWEDTRGGPDSDIYGTRVTPSGTILDPSGIAISVWPEDQGAPSISFDGTNYFVVWTDIRGGVTTDIYGARINPAGIVLDPSGITISTAPSYQFEPSISFNGVNYLVAWSDFRSGSRFDIYGARIEPNGHLLDSTGVMIARTECALNAFPQSVVAFNGIDHIVVWEDRRNGPHTDIYGARVNLSGTVIDTFPVTLQRGNQSYPTIAHGGGDSILVFYSGFVDNINNRPANTMRIWGKFLPPVGIEESALGGQKFDARNILEISPNPFAKLTKVSFSTGHRAKSIELKIYDVSGRVVKSFSFSSLVQVPPAGSSIVTWHGDDNSGRQLPAGVYFCRLENGDQPITEKIVKVE